MNPANLSERALAALLTTSLEDRDWWASVEAEECDAGVRGEAARRAVELYRTTGRLIAPRLTVDVEEPVDHAIGALREIADAWAMRSVLWTPSDQDLRIPTRRVIELFVRLYDLDEWARGLGHPLDLDERGIPEEVWSRGAPEAEISANDLAARFVTAVSTYMEVLGLRESGEWRGLLRSDEFRRAACLEIGQGRAWLVWTRSHLSSEVEPVALGMLFVAQASYVIGCEPKVREELFPTPEYLRALLAKTDADEWLRDQAAELPDWIT